MLVEEVGQWGPWAAYTYKGAGLSLDAADKFIRRFSVCGNPPEPLRVAYLIAVGVGTGERRGAGSRAV